MFVVHRRGTAAASVVAVLVALVAVPSRPAAAAPLVPPRADPTARFTVAAAADTSPPLSALAHRAATVQPRVGGPVEDRGPVPADTGYTGDGALQSAVAHPDVVSAPVADFEGIANTANPTPVAPPDPVGDIGPNHYVEMVNLQFAVYSRTGTPLLGPVPLGALWTGFDIPDCTDLSGDPIVLYDQLADRWILTHCAGTRSAAPVTSRSSGSRAPTRRPTG